MKKQSFFILIFFISAFGFNIHAQTILSATGGCFQNGECQMSWTIGEPIIATCEVGNFCLTQGFHQSLLIITAINNDPFYLTNVKAYPNPATYVVNLSVSETDLTGWNYFLYNADGKLLQKNSISKTITNINVQPYATSNFILKVTKGDAEINSFKIIKNK